MMRESGGILFPECSTEVDEFWLGYVTRPESRAFLILGGKIPSPVERCKDFDQ